jgi:hypothetical protein
MLNRGFHFDTVQMPINPFDPSNRSFGKNVLPIAVQKRMAVFSMKTVSGSGELIVQSLRHLVDKSLQTFSDAWRAPTAPTRWRSMSQLPGATMSSICTFASPTPSEIWKRLVAISRVPIEKTRARERGGRDLIHLCHSCYPHIEANPILCFKPPPELYREGPRYFLPSDQNTSAALTRMTDRREHLEPTRYQVGATLVTNQTITALFRKSPENSSHQLIRLQSVCASGQVVGIKDGVKIGIALRKFKASDLKIYLGQLCLDHQVSDAQVNFGAIHPAADHGNSRPEPEDEICVRFE